ncbi:hypothetical protein DXA98_00605 [Lachnospiraceae bacterium OF09-6]|nr:hypothetical protein DXA98_00605 [Lachnospiraceae bacterium OF09-6]
MFFLNSFDQFLEHHRIRFVKYADNIVLFCRSVQEAEWILPMARDFLTDQLKLSLNNDKIKQRMLTQMKKTLSFNQLFWIVDLLPDGICCVYHPCIFHP